MSTPGELLEALGREARARFGNGGGGASRVYRGRSVEELVPQIQRDLGSDAIIVRRREGLTGGVLGFFQHTYVEIEAMPGAPGVDVYDEEVSPPAPAAPPTPPASPAPPASSASPAGAAPFAPRPAAASPPARAPFAPPDGAPALGYRSPPRRPSVAPGPPARSAPRAPSTPRAPSARPAPAAQQRPGLGYSPGPSAPPARPVGPAWERAPAPAPAPAPGSARTPPPTPFDTREPSAPAAGSTSAYVTAHLAALARADRSKVRPRPSIPDSREDPVAWSPDFQELSPREMPELLPRVERAPERRVVAPGSHARARAGVARSLKRYGIGEELAGELIEGASAHALALAPRSGLAHAVRATLAQRIPVAPPLPIKGAAIVVVGAGGAGKTTCCAALLGAYRKSSSLPASCATIMREADRGELQMILSPYVLKPAPAGAPRSLQALRRARGEGMAVLDTPSLSPSDRAGIRELARLLAELEAERVVVALPATLGATAAAQLLQALRPLGANALAVTHADETDQIGVAVEAACRFGLAPEYMLEHGRGGGWRLRQIGPTGLAEKLLP